MRRGQLGGPVETPAASPAVLRPVLGLGVCLLAAVMPWGLPSEARFVLPMLPYVVVHYWSVDGRGWMPTPMVFAAGLLIDLVTRGPLGFWAAIYLIGHMIARALPGPMAETSAGRFLGYCVTVAVLALIQWLVASAHFVAWQASGPFVYAACVVLFFYPALSFLMMWRTFRRSSSDDGAVRGG